MKQFETNIPIEFAPNPKYDDPDQLSKMFFFIQRDWTKDPGEANIEEKFAHTLYRINNSSPANEDIARSFEYYQVTFNFKEDF